MRFVIFGECVEVGSVPLVPSCIICIVCERIKAERGKCLDVLQESPDYRLAENALNAHKHWQWVLKIYTHSFIYIYTNHIETKRGLIPFIHSFIQPVDSFIRFSWFLFGCCFGTTTHRQSTCIWVWWAWAWSTHNKHLMTEYHWEHVYKVFKRMEDSIRWYYYIIMKHLNLMSSIYI